MSTKVYLLWYTNDKTYPDKDTCLLGVFLSSEEAQAAVSVYADRLRRAVTRKWEMREPDNWTYRGDDYYWPWDEYSDYSSAKIYLSEWECNTYCLPRNCEEERACRTKTNNGVTMLKGSAFRS